jgi:hypothetical protein
VNVSANKVPSAECRFALWFPQASAPSAAPVLILVQDDLLECSALERVRFGADKKENEAVSGYDQTEKENLGRSVTTTKREGLTG